MHVSIMLNFATFLAIAGKSSATLHRPALAARASAPDEAYLSSVCQPHVTSLPIPPCQETINIESACLPNSTTPLGLLAHAQCMCTGSYFTDYIGCLSCLSSHGARSPLDVANFNDIITSVSHALCTGTPTAGYASLFASVQYNSGNISRSVTDTGMTDLYSGKTDIGLYYTVTGSQGPGTITGSATGATRTSGGGSKTTSGGKSSSTGSGTGSAGSQSTSTSKAGAAPTGVWIGGLGAVVGVVGMAVL